MTRSGSIFRKYAITFVVLVGVVLLSSGAVQVLFALEDSQRGLAQLQHEKAVNASLAITQFVRDVERQVGWTSAPAGGASLLPPGSRVEAHQRLLRQVPAVAEVRYLGPTGIEQVSVSRRAMNVVGSGADYSLAPAFLQTRDGASYFSPVYFLGESEPFMTVAVAEAGDGAGVTVAEVNLKLVWDLIARMQVGERGYALVVGSDGHLIAHPDISLVLRKTYLGNLPQVEAALTDTRGPVMSSQLPGVPRVPTQGWLGPRAMVSQSLGGQQVLTAFEPIDPPGWYVFVEQPLYEAFQPLYSALTRTGVLLAVGLLLAVLASVVLARNMVRPIHALQVGAARIGAGHLDHRIEVRTGDEVQELAEGFNRMASHLQGMYERLEERVQERTVELAAAIDALEEKSRQLEVANRHKSDFLASMSHELRTPLNAVIGFSQVLEEELFGELSEKQKEYVRDILASGQLLLSLINEILDLSKVEAGHVDIEESEFSLQDVLDAGFAMLRERAHRHGIALTFDVAAELDTVRGDERKVKQVVFNLLANAVKFTPDGGRVEVTARRVGPDLEVAVQDCGPGIPLEEQELIFEPFYQAHGGSAVVREGTGLGLALAKKFVELHGGRIWVESQPGQGSKFVFTLPLLTANGIATQDAPEPLRASERP